MSTSGGINTDIIVIGSGAAGMSAALTAAEAGASVVLCEKMKFTGGTSNFAEGMFAVESEMQRPMYMQYSRDQSFRDIMDYSHWRANPRLVRAFVDESGATIGWLRSRGVEFSEAATNSPDGIRTVHVLKGPFMAMGTPMMKTLLARAIEQGVDVRKATGVKEILRDSGVIRGVIVESEGSTEEITARVVIVATGGYGNNAEWVKKYCGMDIGINAIPVRNFDKVGDGIRMAWETGAAEEGMGLLHFFRAGPLGPGVAMAGELECAAAQPALWITPQGERFCNESITFNDSYLGAASARLKEGYSYTLFDEATRRHLMEHGIERGVAYKNLPGKRLVNFDAQLKRALEAGNPDVIVADTLEEIAARTGASPATLAATAGEYNRYCETGHDALFAKEQKFLWPVKEPPFYAFKCYTVYLGTLGGIKINERMEVVDTETRVIPGLYAAGTDTGGMYGDSYCYLPASGATLGFAVNSGRIAGRNAASFVKG